MRIQFILVLVAVAGVACARADASSARVEVRAASQSSPVAHIDDIALPRDYRDWRVVAVAREEAPLDDIRAILGNDAAIRAYREGRRTFPDGAIIARLAWSYESSAENDKAFGRKQSFVAGHPKNGVQFMVKNARKFAATGGWGYAQFDDGKRASEAAHKDCHACHTAVTGRDFVFTRYAP